MTSGIDRWVVADGPLGKDLDYIRSELAEEDFLRIVDLVYRKAGIEIESQKKGMVEMRLRKRLRQLQLKSFREYIDYLFSPQGMKTELFNMVDLMTTNMTSFFRERPHFEFLRQQVLPDRALQQRSGFGGRPFRAWSAGCSTGEEAYSIAIELQQFAEQHPGFEFRIVATDISSTVLDVARQAIYDEDRVEPIGQELRRKYLLRGRDRNAGKVRIVPELRDKVEFRRLNFMDENFGFRAPFDIIFCRNVIIYFDLPTQQRLLNKFMTHLEVGSYLFMGHSETLTGMELPLTHLAPATYQRYADGN